jgi:hypothetical protein
MHPTNLEWLGVKIATMVIAILATEDETYKLEPRTNAHRDAYVEAMQQLTKHLEENTQITKETNYDL